MARCALKKPWQRICKNQSERFQDNNGLSLIELIFALFIFVLATTGLYISYLSSSRLIQDATNQMRAVEDLGDIMEQIQATPFNVLLTTFPSGVVDGGATDYADLVGGYTLQAQTIVITYPSQTTGRVEVLATVNWQYQGRLYTKSLSTIRTSG